MRPLIREPKIKRDAHGDIVYVSFAFGPHHFVEVEVEDGKVMFATGTTHHGFRVDASEVNSELEKIVSEVMSSHSDKAF